MLKSVLHQILATTPDSLFFHQYVSDRDSVTKIALNELTLQDSSEEFSLTNEECSWVASLHNFGRIGGPFLAAFLVDVVGRKPLLITCSLTFFTSWLLILFTRKVWILYVVRTIIGAAIGVHDTISNVYIAESCSPKIRGTFASIAMAFFYAGELIAFILVTYLPYNQVAIVNAAIGCVSLLCVFLLKETVQFLIIKGNYKSAERNYYWLNGPKTLSTESKFEEIKENIQRERSKVSFQQLFMSKANFISLRVILIISVLEMFTGFEAITSFASMAFTKSEFLTPNEFTILFGLFQFLSICFSSFIIDRFNRRTIFLISFFATTITHCCTSALYYIHQNLTVMPFFSWLIFITITTYATIYSAGILPIYYIVRGEILPQSVKAIGGCMAVFLNSIIGFVTTKIFLYISNEHGLFILKKTGTELVAALRSHPQRVSLVAGTI
ncbi:hypothetical protein PGB90_001398 [Kerria lacca]